MNLNPISFTTNATHIPITKQGFSALVFPIWASIANTAISSFLLAGAVTKESPTILGILLNLARFTPGFFATVCTNTFNLFSLKNIGARFTTKHILLKFTRTPVNVRSAVVARTLDLIGLKMSEAFSTTKHILILLESLWSTLKFLATITASAFNLFNLKEMGAFLVTKYVCDFTGKLIMGTKEPFTAVITSPFDCLFHNCPKNGRPSQAALFVQDSTHLALEGHK